MSLGLSGIVFALVSQSQPFFAASASVSTSAGNKLSLRQRAADPADQHTFASFIAEHGREYVEGTSQFEERKELFEQRLRQVKNHNSRLDRRWTAGVNHLADRTEAEFARLQGWRGVRARPSTRAHGVVSSHPHVGMSLAQTTALPKEKSWAHLKAMQAEVDQGACGGCWAAAASVTLNAGAEIQGINRTFSAQDFICGVPNPHKCGGTGGCQGATVELAFNYLMEFGAKTEAEMPYEGTDTTCPRQDMSVLRSSLSDNLDAMVAIGTHHAATPESPGPRLGFIGWERLPENKYAPLMRAITEHGPVAVSVAGDTWQLYESGIFDGCKKDAIIGHGVTLMGFGKEGSDKYWHIKNSWGSSWGENGNIRLLRKDDEESEHCGVDNQPDQGTACEGGPSEVRVCGMCAILYDSVVPFFKAPPVAA